MSVGTNLEGFKLQDWAEADTAGGFVRCKLCGGSNLHLVTCSESDQRLPDNAEWTDIWVTGGYRFWRRPHIDQDAIQYGMNKSFWILSALEIEEAGSELAALDKRIEKWGGKRIARPIVDATLTAHAPLVASPEMWVGHGWREALDKDGRRAADIAIKAGDDYIAENFGAAPDEPKPFFPDKIGRIAKIARY